MNNCKFLLLLFLAFLLNSCHKDSLRPIDALSPKTVSQIQALETYGDTVEVYKLNAEIVNPEEIIDSYDLRLLPFAKFKSRMDELISQSNNAQIIAEFTGIAIASKDSIEHFSAYYENGAFVSSIIFTPEEQPRVAPECPNPHIIVFTEIQTTDWWQINGNGTVVYLGSSTETYTVIVEMCTPGGFDQYYTDHTSNTQHLNATQARIWLFDRILDKLFSEGTELVNPCKPENSSADNIRDVLDELEVFSEEAFFEEFVNQLSACEEGLDQLILLDGGILANKTCKESFNFISVGAGYTAQVNDIHQTYLTSLGGFYAFYIGVMCIQVSGTDAFGNPLTPEKAAELSAYAMDNARLALFNELGGTIRDNVAAREAYKTYIEQELRILTGPGATSSVSYGACAGGNIPSTEYRVNPFGIPLCIDLF